MTQDSLYDWLLKMGVREPAVLRLGERCIAGRWEVLSEQLPNGHICRTGRVGVHVIGEGDTWNSAHAMAEKRLA